MMDGAGIFDAQGPGHGGSIEGGGRKFNIQDLTPYFGLLRKGCRSPRG